MESIVMQKWGKWNMSYEFCLSGPRQDLRLTWLPPTSRISKYLSPLKVKCKAPSAPLNLSRSPLRPILSTLMGRRIWWLHSAACSLFPLPPSHMFPYDMSIAIFCRKTRASLGFAVKSRMPQRLFVVLLACLVSTCFNDVIHGWFEKKTTNYATGPADRNQVFCEFWKGRYKLNIQLVWD